MGKNNNKICSQKRYKKDLGNQRGLFITDIVGKVGERILVERNRDRIQKRISPFQCRGIKNRSVSDNLFVLNCIMQLFKIRKQNNYILFTDLHKCFNKLWLEDAIVEMVLCGMKVEDAGYLHKMNKEVQAIVSTPAGNTEEIALNAIVKQGTVAGPIMAGVTTDKINRIEIERPVMYYNIEIKEPAYVDDVAGIGTKETIEDMSRRMQLMERVKKFTYNIKEGKTDYMKITNTRSTAEDLSLEVKKVTIKEIEKYKYLGDVHSSQGDNKVKIKWKDGEADVHGQQGEKTRTL